MTWEELKEEAKKMGYHIGKKHISLEVEEKNIKYIFFKDGDVLLEDRGINGVKQIHTGLEYDQMLAIMKALQQEVKE